MYTVTSIVLDLTFVLLFTNCISNTTHIRLYEYQKKNLLIISDIKGRKKSLNRLWYEKLVIKPKPSVVIKLSEIELLYFRDL